MEAVLIAIAMFVLRLGVPLAITAVIAVLLRRLDAQWETEAAAQREQEEIPAGVKALQTAEQPCWEIKGCPEEKRAQCPACKAWDVPCWVARLRATGRLPAECHGCERFSLGAAA